VVTDAAALVDALYVVATSLDPVLPAVARPIVGALVDLLVALVKADGNTVAEEEALMQAEEAIARERARRKFGGQGG
jgi:hypothetical protein